MAIATTQGLPPLETASPTWAISIPHLTGYFIWGGVQSSMIDMAATLTASTGYVAL